MGVESSAYALVNAAPQAERRFSALEALYDPVTVENLAGTGIAEGWHCLELGAGRGSIAAWLARRTFPGGHVLATDLDPRWLRAANPPGVEVRRHDITRDPLPENTFDLVHARLVLMHLPERAAVLRRLVGALRPGGHLVIEDYDLRLAPHIAGGGGADDELIDTVMEAFTDLLVGHGADPAYGRGLPGRLADAGLTGVRGRGELAFAHGRDAGAALYGCSVEQTRAELLDRGRVTAAQLDRYRDLLADPGTTFLLPCLVSARGHRPV
jgi:SAM-dependent methyltransferase